MFGGAFRLEIAMKGTSRLHANYASKVDRDFLLKMSRCMSSLNIGCGLRELNVFECSLSKESF